MLNIINWVPDYRCVATWHRFVYLNMLHNIYIVNIHYVCKHLTTTIKKMVSLQTYSARCMERTVGLLGRRIKSKTAIAQNAQNQMVMLAAYRDLEKIDLAAMTRTNKDNGSESNKALNDDRIFQLGNGSNEIQIFNVHQSLLDSYDCWNLKNLVHNYWTRKYPYEQGHIIDEIMVGTVLHIQGSIISSEINKEPKNARIRNFVQLSLVYDVYARQSSHAAQLEWGSFHGELLMFFPHKYSNNICWLYYK